MAQNSYFKHVLFSLTPNLFSPSLSASFAISTIELNSKQLAVKTESGRSLLKDGRRSTESPEEGTHMSMLESHFTTTPHIILEEGTSHGTPLEDHDGVRIVCEDTKGTVPLEDCRSTTSSDVRRSGIHLEDTVPLKDRRATSHTGSTGGLVVLENPRVASLRSMGARSVLSKGSRDYTLKGLGLYWRLEEYLIGREGQLNWS